MKSELMKSNERIAQFNTKLERRYELMQQNRIELSLSTTAAYTAIGYDDPTMLRSDIEQVDFRRKGFGAVVTFSCGPTGITRLLEDLDDRKDDHAGFEEEPHVRAACVRAIASIIKQLAAHGIGVKYERKYMSASRYTLTNEVAK